MLHKAQKKDPSITEEAFLGKLIDAWEQVKVDQAYILFLCAKLKKLGT